MKIKKCGGKYNEHRWEYWVESGWYYVNRRWCSYCFLSQRRGEFKGKWYRF